MAVSHQTQINDQNYLNWVKAGLALKYTKEGLESFINNETREFHSFLLKQLGQQPPQNCGHCTTDNLLPHKSSACPAQRQTCICSRHTQNRHACPNNVCGTLFNDIVAAHRYKGPAWKNSHISQWVIDHWEVSKTFLPSTGGYINITSASDTDLSGLVNIGINLENITKRHSFTRVNSDGAPDDFCQCRTARNEILHNASQSLTDVELRGYLRVMTATLQCTAALLSDTSAQQSIIKLSQLENSTFEITVENITEVKEMALLAIREEVRKQVVGLRGEGENQKLNVKNECAVHIDAIKEESEKQKQAVASSGVQAEKRAIDCISLESDKQREMMKIEGEEARGNAVKAIKSTVEVYRRDAAKDMQKKGIQQVEAVKSKGKIQRRYVQGAGSSQMKVVKGEGRKQRQYVQRTGKSQVKAVKDEGKYQRRRIQQTTETQADARYQKEKNELRHNLKANYLAQLQPDTLPKVDKLYVEPSMELVIDGNEGTDDTDSSTNIKDVFFQGQTKFKRIYISGDAGHGKTALCKMLVLAWCQVHSNKRINIHIPADFLEVMKKFDFVFYIALRNFRTDWLISQMIKRHYFKDKDFHNMFIKNECDKDSCLVILDGLDEWVLPTDYETPMHTTHGLPDLCHVQSFTVLTTTRSWKLEALRLKSDEIDRQVRLTGISWEASCRYVKNMVDLLNQKKNVRKESDDFDEKLKEKDLNHFRNIPILLKQLITLWHQNEDEITGQSQVRLYSAMVNHLLRDAWKRNKMMSLSGRTSQKTELPKCLKEKQYCKIHKNLLLSLAYIAFTAASKGHLIFDHVEATLQDLTEDDIKYCLIAGLLCQDTYASPPDDEKKKLSFLHKSFQDFLAAVYLVVNPEAAQLPQTCNTVGKIRDMDYLFIFVCGMDSRIMTPLSQQIMNIVGNEEKSNQTGLKLKHTTTFLDEFEKMCIVQELMLDCVIESRESGQPLPHVSMVAIFPENSDELNNLKHLISANKVPLEYVYISDEPYLGLEFGKKKPIEDFLACVRLVSECRSVQHMHLELHERLSPDTEALLEKALFNHWSLSTLVVEGAGCEPFIRYIFSDRVITLVKLHFGHIDISSPIEYQRIVKALEKATHLKTLELERVDCRKDCRVPDLDLSRCSQLQKVILKHCNVNMVTINTASLTYCEVRCRALHFVLEPHVGAIIQTLNLRELKDSLSLDKIATILANLSQLSYLKLADLNFGDRDVCLSPEATYLKNVELINVMMVKTAMIRFFTSIPVNCHEFKLEFNLDDDDCGGGGMRSSFLDNFVDILPDLTHVTHLRLEGLDFGDRDVCLSPEATRLESVELVNVLMEKTAMIRFLTSIPTACHKVSLMFGKQWKIGSRKNSGSRKNRDKKPPLDLIVDILPDMTQISQLKRKCLNSDDPFFRRSTVATRLERVEIENVTMTDIKMIQFHDSNCTINYKVDCNVHCWVLEPFSIRTGPSRWIEGIGYPSSFHSQPQPTVP